MKKTTREQLYEINKEISNMDMSDSRKFQSLHIIVNGICNNRNENTIINIAKFQLEDNRLFLAINRRQTK